MSKSTEKIFESVKNKLLNEELGGVISLKPINKIEASPKADWETKFDNFLAENGSLEPIVNAWDKEKYNTKAGDEKIQNKEGKFTMDSKLAGSYKVSNEVENIASHNYDYSPSVDNINNVNAQEVLTGIQCEINYNKELTLDEAKEIAVKNLAKDPLHYVKEGQFGIKGLGYSEAMLNTKENSGETYGGSGFSEKLKDSDNAMQVVKESKECCPKEQINEELGGVVTSGNPNSLAAMSGQVIRDMMKERMEDPLPMDGAGEDEGTAVSYSDTYATMENEEKEMPMDEKKDHDGDGDIDSDDYMAAKDKAIKANMKKKTKKENIETKLAEIGKAGDITKLEAQLEFLNNHINEKIQRVSSINEDDNLKELIDKKKMKDMQREIKLLEKRKGKMEKVYEKMTGNKYQQSEVVDEINDQSVFDFANPTGGDTLDPEPKKVGKGTGKSYLNRPSGPAKQP